MRRKVESPLKASPVDAHERTRDYLSEEELVLSQVFIWDAFGV